MTDHTWTPDPIFDNQTTFFTSDKSSNILQLETMAYLLANDLFDNYNLTDKSYKYICELIDKVIVADHMQKVVKSLQNELLCQIKIRQLDQEK